MIKSERKSMRIEHKRQKNAKLVQQKLGEKYKHQQEGFHRKFWLGKDVLEQIKGFEHYLHPTYFESQVYCAYLSNCQVCPQKFLTINKLQLTNQLKPSLEIDFNSGDFEGQMERILCGLSNFGGGIAQIFNKNIVDSNNLDQKKLDKFKSQLQSRINKVNEKITLAGKFGLQMIPVDQQKKYLRWLLMVTPTQYSRLSCIKVQGKDKNKNNLECKIWVLPATLKQDQTMSKEVMPVNLLEPKFISIFSKVVLQKYAKADKLRKAITNGYPIKLPEGKAFSKFDCIQNKPTYGTILQENPQPPQGNKKIQTYLNDVYHSNSLIIFKGQQDLTKLKQEILNKFPGYKFELSQSSEQQCKAKNDETIVFMSSNDTKDQNFSRQVQNLLKNRIQYMAKCSKYLRIQPKSKKNEVKQCLSKLGLKTKQYEEKFATIFEFERPTKCVQAYLILRQRMDKTVKVSFQYKSQKNSTTNKKL